MANRFTRRNIFGRFDKMSLDELSFLPMAMQQAHDQTLAQAEALRTYKQALNQDISLRDKLQGEINTGITDIADSLMSEGINPQVTQNLIKLKRRRDDLVNPGGQLYDIESNFNKYMEFDKQLREAEGVGLSTKNKYRRYVLSQYKGVEAGDSIYTPDIVADADAVKIAIEAVKDMPTHKIETLLNNRGITPVGTTANGTTIYQYGKETIEQNDPRLIRILAEAALESSPELQSMLQRDQMFYEGLGAEAFGYGKGTSFGQYKQSIYKNALDAAEIKAYDYDRGIDVNYKFDKFNKGYFDYQQEQWDRYNPTYRMHGFQDGISSDSIDDYTNLNGTQVKHLKDRKGNIVTREEFVSEYMNSPVLGKDYKKMSKAAQEAKLNQMYTNITGGTGFFGRLWNATDPAMNAIYATHSLEDIPQAELEAIKDAKTKEFTQMMKQYNATAGNAKGKTFTNVEDFAEYYNKMLKSRYHQVPLETIDKNVDPTDVNTKNFIDNKNLSYLNGKELTVYSENENMETKTYYAEDVNDFINKLKNNEGIEDIQFVGVDISNPENTGGSVFDITDGKGNVYRIGLEPTSRNMRMAYEPQRKFNESLYSPVFGVPPADDFPIMPMSDGTLVRIRPTKYFTEDDPTGLGFGSIMTVYDQNGNTISEVDMSLEDAKAMFNAYSVGQLHNTHSPKAKREVNPSY